MQRSLASPTPDGATILLGRIGFTTLPRQPDTYTQLDCRFEESVGGARVDRSGPRAFLCAVSCLRGVFLRFFKSLHPYALEVVYPKPGEWAAVEDPE